MEKKIYLVLEKETDMYSFGSTSVVREAFINKEDAEYCAFRLNKNSSASRSFTRIYKYCVEIIDVSHPIEKDQKLYKKFIQQKKEKLQKELEEAEINCARMCEIKSELDNLK